MRRNIENMIKGRIAETIIEELFRELGFYVIRFGKEHTGNPLTQLEDFIKQCGGKIELEKNDPEYIYTSTYLSKLPDFVIVSKEGAIDFIEVKFRHNSIINMLNDTDVLDVFPSANIIVVNTEVDDKTVTGEEDKEILEKLKKSRLHVWIRANEYSPGDKRLLTNVPFKVWIKDTFDIENDDTIDKYEELVSKWLDKGLGNKAT